MLTLGRRVKFITEALKALGDSAVRDFRIVEGVD